MFRNPSRHFRPIWPDALVGTGVDPFWFSHELEVGGNRALEVEFTNRTATATRIYLTAHGYKKRPLDQRSNVHRVG